MPKGDRKGPMGLGPMSGRGAGRCAGYPVAGYMHSGPGRGSGCGMGRGRSFGRSGANTGVNTSAWGRSYGAGRGLFARLACPSSSVYGQPAPKQELAFLEEQMQTIQSQLDAVKQRIYELEGQEEEGKS